MYFLVVFFEGFLNNETRSSYSPKLDFQARCPTPFEVKHSVVSVKNMLQKLYRWPKLKKTGYQLCVYLKLQILNFCFSKIVKFLVLQVGGWKT